MRVSKLWENIFLFIFLVNCSFRCFIRYNKVFLDSYPYWHHLISRVHLSILPLSHKNAYTVTHPSFLSFPLAGSGEQVVVTFVAFGCSKSHSFFLKRSSHLKKRRGGSSPVKPLVFLLLSACAQRSACPSPPLANPPLSAGSQMGWQE